MKKNYIYLSLLLIVTVFVTLLFANLYERKNIEISYSYEVLNKITSKEFEEYMIEHPDTIIYIADKTNLNNNKFDKKIIKKLEKLNLLEIVIYIEKSEVTKTLQNTLKEKYLYEYSEENLPTIIVVSDGEIIQTSIIDENSDVNTIIDYEVFE